MKFLVNIEEVVCETFEVDAESMEEALEVAREKYVSGEFVLEPGELISTRASAYDKVTDSWTEEVEF